MTLLLYDQIHLEERASRHLNAWKAWHLILYTLAAIFGLVNFIVLQHTMQIVDDNCPLFPRELEFRVMEIPEPVEVEQLNITIAQKNITAQDNPTKNENENLTSDKTTTESEVNNADNVDNNNTTAITGNTTHRQVLDTARTLFESGSDCQFAEFMPILSTICAAVWMTLFTMCPGGGRSRSGLQQPWSILAPALLFSLVMVGLTGHSFATTNRGLHAFCEAFFDVTNTTACSAVDAHLENGWNATWSMSGRISATKAASAGVVAAWTCAAALLLARCLAAPDFAVKRTGVYLTKDPQQKIMRHLKSPRSQRSSQSSPTKRDTVSIRSEPTAITELVSASVEPGADSAPSSLMATPMKTHRNSDIIEMTYSPGEHGQ